MFERDARDQRAGDKCRRAAAVVRGVLNRRRFGHVTRALHGNRDRAAALGDHIGGLRELEHACRLFTYESAG